MSAQPESRVAASARGSLASLLPDTQNQAWRGDTTSFAQRMLAKMGWREGRGLGKREDGVVEHVRVKRRLDRSHAVCGNGGIGCVLLVEKVVGAASLRVDPRRGRRGGHLSSRPTVGSTDSRAKLGLRGPRAALHPLRRRRRRGFQLERCMGMRFG